MKKFLFALAFASFAWQSAPALESNLNSSLEPFRALVNSQTVQNTFLQSDFIISFERHTPRVDKLGRVFYKLKLKRYVDSDMMMDAWHHSSSSDSSSSSSSNRPTFEVVDYIVEFDVIEAMDPPVVVAQMDPVGPLEYILVGIRRVRDRESSHRNHGGCGNHCNDSSSSS